MRYTIHPPCIELADLVKSFWVFEGHASESAPFEIRTTANAFPELIFHYKGTFRELAPGNKSCRSFAAGIHGQTNRYRDFTISENFGMIGVHLYPYAIEPIFGISSSEVTNQLPDLHLVKRAYQSGLEDRIAHAKTTNERIAIISGFILASLHKTPHPAVVYSVKSIVENKGAVDMKGLSDKCSLSHRQFERRFKEATGFSAKHFSRLIRFENALKSDAKAGSLTELSLELGYYDQSHFISEFKEFSGNTPYEFFQRIRK